MYSLIFIALAAILNSLMDTMAHHFSTSIFKNLNPNFWNPNVSWRTAKVWGGYKFDSWHIAKSLMIFCLCFSIVFYTSIFKHWIFDWFLLGTIWNVSFVLFYTKILIKK